MINTNKIITLLKELKSELIKQKMWDIDKPTIKQLSSPEPFCVDTLKFEQWLQWIFIPKMNKILLNKKFNGLSYKSDISSMADYTFKKYNQHTDMIVKIIKNIDLNINNINNK